MIRDPRLLKPTTVTIGEFEEAFFAEHERLKKVVCMPYVPIPDLRKTVAARLANRTFRVLHFKEYLFRMMEARPDKKIILHETGVRSRGGIFDDGNYYHFVTIQDR